GGCSPDTATDALGRVTDRNYDPLKRLISDLHDANELASEIRLKDECEAAGYSRGQELARIRLSNY
ncbi:hypothetical protein AB4084_29060, partial [Lysobacter sp. 2RAB21]